MSESAPLKRCNGCGIEKPHDAFSRAQKGDSFGLASRCKECRAKKNLDWHFSNPDRARRNRRKYYANNRDAEIAQATGWRKSNPERHLENYRSWALDNRTHLTAKQNARRAAQMQAMPQWLSPIHRAQIQEEYDVAKAVTVQTGIEHHVDHIVPLQGKTVCGLHVPWNLQVITARENLSKKNKVF